MSCLILPQAWHLFQVAIVEMRPLYKNLLLSINNYYEKWLSGNFDEIYKLWRKAQIYHG